MIKITIFSFAKKEDVIRDIRAQIYQTGKKSSISEDYELSAGDKTLEEVSKTNKWIVFISKTGECKVMIEGRPKLIECNSEDIKVVKIEIGKNFYLHANMKTSYFIICEIL